MGALIVASTFVDAVRFIGDNPGFLSTKALEIRSRDTETQYNFGAALSCNNLGTAFTEKGDVEEGIDYYEKAIALAPRYADAHKTTRPKSGSESSPNDAEHTALLARSDRTPEWTQRMRSHQGRRCRNDNACGPNAPSFEPVIPMGGTHRRPGDCLRNGQKEQEAIQVLSGHMLPRGLKGCA